MREIKFKGKTKRNGTWVYGFYANANGVAMIIDEIELSNADCFTGTVEFAFYRIIPKTVGQFTGLHDKNGVEIYEGDIIKRTIHCSYRNDGMAYDVLFQVPGIQELYGNKIEKDDANNSVDLWETSFEVIGNIHDNPELLT